MDSNSNLIRYEIIHKKNSREILMLRGNGCKWRKCIFCDYHLDFSRDTTANYQLNIAEIQNVTGLYKRLEVINSGSFCDLDKDTVQAIIHQCKKCSIDHIHMEFHWMHREQISHFRELFFGHGITPHIKMGVETFDSGFRDEVLLKGMEHATPSEISLYADEVCLLFGLNGQTLESMTQDINTGLSTFDRICINIMTENTTSVRPDRKVIDLFIRELYPLYRENPQVDILMNNTDFGVGGINE